MVLLGTGMAPNSDFVGKNLKTAKDGGIETDIHHKASQDNVWAAGDVAQYPFFLTG